jgi:hypothetical protein
MSVLGRSCRSPASASACRTQFRRASGCTFSCSPSRRNVGRGSDSRYSRTARSRSSSRYFLGAGHRAFLPGPQDRTSLGRLRRTGGPSVAAESEQHAVERAASDAAQCWPDDGRGRWVPWPWPSWRCRCTAMLGRGDRCQSNGYSYPRRVTARSCGRSGVR